MLAGVIYNSRNFICSYSGIDYDKRRLHIYNSRNFICSYSSRRTSGRHTAIYNSRNFICSYSCCWQKCCITVRYKSICSKNYSK